MNYKKTAEEILNYIGGESNVTHLEHCSTRLRFSLADHSKVNLDSLKKVQGVMGVVTAAQCQIIIGNSVIEVYDELIKLADFDNIGKQIDRGNVPKQKFRAVLLDFVVGIFQPLVPAIAGAGILKAMLSLLVLLGWVDSSGSTYRILLSIGDSALYFLPVLVAYTTASKLKCNRIVAVAAVGTLILPSMTAMIGEGTVLFGFPITNINYAYQVFPAILCIIFYSFMEKFWTKFSPKPIRVFFVPLMCFLITMPVTLLLLGPLGYRFGEGLTTIILFLYANFGFIAVALLAVALPFMVATGMHKAFVPYAVGSISTMGEELLYMPASLAHNIAEGGACFGVALRTKNKELRATAISAGISAVFGITEPALYGISIQYKRVLASVMIGSGIGGLFIGLFGLKAFVTMGPGLAGMAMFVDPNNSKNIIYAFVGFAVSFSISLVASLFLFRDKEAGDKEAEIPNHANGVSSIMLLSPMDGRTISLEEVNDNMFSEKILGDGVAIIPDKGELFAPADGKITMIFDTKHALAMTLENGVELLFHVGLDTVKMQGENFEPQVHITDYVKKGDLLLKFDIEKIKRMGYDMTTPIVVTNSDLHICKPEPYNKVKMGEPFLMVE